MPKINVLPKSVAELIAAGEVVERPSSVIKELVENSIDAGATSVTVEIKNGGIKYMRVSDDGCGISSDDVPTAFMSHGTSKIKTGADLDSILTLGFRGEALPSIAAVSRLSMLTRTADGETGTSIDINGGEVVSTDEAGCPEGTTIIIRDLFYNTPARMKFLKRDMTEGTYVADVVTKTAISHPEIRFSLIKDGKQMFSTPGNGNLLSTIYAALGRQVSEGLIECPEYEHKGIKVRGYISKPLNNRSNRNYQYCYVNGRFVRISAAAAALDEAYKNRIMVGKFPMCFLFIDIPPEKVDVNVHPAKTEIRFSEDTAIFEAIYYAAKSALNLGDTERPGIVLADRHKNVLFPKQPDTSQLRFGGNMHSESVREKEPQTPKAFSVPSAPVSKSPVSVEETVSHFSTQTVKDEPVPEQSAFRHEPVYVPPEKKCNIDIFVDDEPEKTEKKVPEKVIENISESVQESIPENTEDNNISDVSAGTAPEEAEQETVFTETQDFEQPSFDFGKLNREAEAEKKKDVPDFRIVGEAFKTYIIVEQGSKLYIIDKHAAHERMIFNRLSSEGLPEDSQLLLAPVTVVLSGKEYACVLENLEVFSKGGFKVEDFGKNTVIVSECPVTLEKEDINLIITEMAGELLRGNLKPVPEKLDWLYHNTACRAAVKAGDDLKKEEMEAFVAKLLSDDSVRYCPHGRPVMYELSRHEIEKQFGRV